MKLSEFILLSESEKKNTVIHLGVLIGKRHEPNVIVFLFQLGNYYVETYCNNATKAVQEFRAFMDPVHLSPYLKMISLDDLFS